MSDSFISHKNQLRDNERAKQAGLEAYQSELNEKIHLLTDLLAVYDDGRRKSLFCTAVNLLELQDVRRVVAQIKEETKPEDTLKERSALAVGLLQAMAEARRVSFTLRRKHER